MSDENVQPNNPTPDQGGQNPAGGTESNTLEPKPGNALPSQRQQVDPELANDPGYQKWVEDTKDLSTAYKRYSDSSKEAKTKAEELQKTQSTLTEREQYIESVTAELNQVFEANPELQKKFKEAYLKMQKGELPTNKDLGGDGDKQVLPPEYEELRSEVEFQKNERKAKMRSNIETFKETYGEFIEGDKDWKIISSYAEGLYGKPDRNGKPMDEVKALKAALEIQHPEIRDDQVRLRTLAERMNRDSASSPGDISGGSSGGSSAQLTPEQQKAAAGFGMTPEEYAKWSSR